MVNYPHLKEVGILGMVFVKKFFKKFLNIVNIHLDNNQKWLLISLVLSGLLITYAHPTLVKAIISDRQFAAS